MNCEIVATGTELLLGDSIDTNSLWLAEKLNAAGIGVTKRTVVGDNVQRLASTLNSALDASNSVIITGGLGPTHDDITRDAIADVCGSALITDERQVQHIAEIFAARNRSMSESNKRQAQRPKSATFIEQATGTAPGIVCETRSKVINALPGPPHEMREMFARSVLPDLLKRAGKSAVIASRSIRTWGASESIVGELLEGRIAFLDASNSGVTIALLAKGVEGIYVRLTVKSDSSADAAALLDVEEQEIRDVLGDLVFGIDDESLEMVTGRQLVDVGLTLGTAESMTGGLIASRITSVPGSSEWFKGSVVSYATDVKHSVLGVPDGPVVTPEAAVVMSQGARKALDCDVAIGVTGVAGPSLQESVPVGRVYLAIVGPWGVESKELNVPGGRNQIRALTCVNALNALRLKLRMHSSASDR